MAEKTALIEVEIAFALPERQWLLSRRVPAGATARQAVLSSGLAQECPELRLESCPLGIFGREIAGDRVLRDGDRVEIYRPLRRDPREARRELAARGPGPGRRGESGSNRG